MSASHSMNDLAEQVSTQLHQMEARLVDDYGPAREADIHAAVQEEHDRFREAKVTTFVPILIERHVRSRLGRTA